MKIEKIPKSKNNYQILYKIGCKEKEFVLNLASVSSITGRFDLVITLIDEIQNLIPEFDVWFSHIFDKYVNSGIQFEGSESHKKSYNSEVIYNNIDNIMAFSREYIEKRNIDFSKFVDAKKVSKTSILFTESDLKNIAISSTALKMYSLFSSDINLKPPENMHKKLFNQLMKNCFDEGIPGKVFEVIKSKAYRSYTTDSNVWEWASIIYSDTIDSYIFSLFNFLMSSLIPTLEVDKNPISFLSSTVNSSIRWFMGDIYKNRVLYAEALGSIDDTGHFGDTFKTCCYSDLIVKIASCGMRLIESEYNIGELEFEKIKSKINKMENIYSYMKLVTLPILKDVLNIPYHYLITISPKHVLLSGIFMRHLARDFLDIEYPNICEFLVSFPNSDTNYTEFLTTKSSYIIKDTKSMNKKIDDEDSSFDPIFGLTEFTFRRHLFEAITGVLNSSKRKLHNIITEKPFPRITNLEFENEIFKFFGRLYGGKLKEQFQSMSIILDDYLS